jgi:Rrf2 family protein
VSVRISAKVDYAVRAAVSLATAQSTPVKGDAIARDQDIPLHYLENILSELRRAGIVASQRGAEGGYWLARKPTEVTIADIIRAVEGPLANIRGVRPEKAKFRRPSEHLQEVWIAVRANLRAVLEAVTLEHVISGRLPASVRRLASDQDAWQPH